MLCFRNFGKCVSRIKNDFGKVIGGFGYCTLGAVKYNKADVISRFTCYSNNVGYQNSITPNRSTRKNDRPSLNTGLYFVSAGLLSFLGLKDDSEKEPELITTIKRGILLIQVWITCICSNFKSIKVATWQGSAPESKLSYWYGVICIIMKFYYSKYHTSYWFYCTFFINIWRVGFVSLSLPLLTSQPLFQYLCLYG